MHIKIRRSISKIKNLYKYQTLYETESLVLKNRLLFIYKLLGNNFKGTSCEKHS